jgi:hypothetical protein
MTGLVRPHAPMTAAARRAGDRGVAGAACARRRSRRSQSITVHVYSSNGEEGARLDAAGTTTDIGSKGIACSGGARQE